MIQPKPVRPEPTFRLSPGERDSALWQTFTAYLAERLERTRFKNDQPQSETETGLLRGEIRCLRSLLALGGDRPPADGR